ncbi:hypothetical protein BC828DRAFT_404978 [Blastocladiella britannica]|nr:hypothetical protein BC828DRAFT_404978 [Blastocladiella britannica]
MTASTSGTTHRKLLLAVHDCSVRGLTSSALWASQALDALHSHHGLPAAHDAFDLTLNATTDVTVASFASGTSALTMATRHTVGTGPGSARSGRRSRAAPALPPAFPSVHDMFADNGHGLRQYLLAKSYFDVRQLDQCVHVLGEANAPVLVFLCQYARYLIGERRKLELIGDPLMSQIRTAENPFLGDIAATLESYLADHCHVPDPWIHLGVCLVRMGRQRQAAEFLAASVTEYEYNWAAWNELTHCNLSDTELSDLLQHVPHGLPLQFFLVQTALTRHVGKQHLSGALRAIEDYLLPTSPVVLDLKARSDYAELDFTSAIAKWSAVFSADPFRLTSLDLYAHALHSVDVNQSSLLRLDALARRALAMDVQRPEGWIAQGDAYALRDDPVRAAEAFSTALRLGPDDDATWVLLGMALMERGVVYYEPAVLALERAIAINSQNQNAYFVLGSIYKSLQRWDTAITYFQRAISIRPSDARLWAYAAKCYRATDRPALALVAATRAVRCTPQYVDPDMLAIVGLLLLQSERERDRDRATAAARTTTETEGSLPTPSASFGAADAESRHQQGGRAAKRVRRNSDAMPQPVPLSPPRAAAAARGTAFWADRTDSGSLANGRENAATRRHRQQQQHHGLGTTTSTSAGEALAEAAASAAASVAAKPMSPPPQQPNRAALLLHPPNLPVLPPPTDSRDPVPWLRAAWYFRTKVRGASGDLDADLVLDVTDALVPLTLAVRANDAEGWIVDELVEEYLDGAREAAERVHGGRARVRRLDAMATAFVVGLGVATTAIFARGAVRAYQNHGPEFVAHIGKYMRPPTSGSSLMGGSAHFARGGFEPKMSRREAASILGLREHNIQLSKLKEHHRKVMLLNHPDRGGSPFVASKINEAKDMLEKFASK